MEILEDDPSVIFPTSNFDLFAKYRTSIKLKAIRLSEMADMALNFVLDQLNMIQSRCNESLPAADMNQIEVLLEDLTFVRNLLDELKPEGAEHSKIMLELRSLAYETLEDLDHFSANLLEKEDHAFHPPLKLGYFAESISSIKIRMLQMEKEPEVHKVEHSSSGILSNEMSFVMEERTGLVGLEDEALKLKDQLTGGRQQLEVIALVGMGGIGKTTLAKHLFNDDSIIYHFDIRASACVSREYKRRDVLLGLLNSISKDKDKIKSSSDDTHQELLYKHLKGYRYLIVIDDLWSLDAWEDLKCLLPNDRNGSRILVTTRLNDVISRIRPESTPHVLRFLTEDESWDLLRHKAFGNRECPSDLYEVGKKIAAKCGGLPLAIVVVAGLLAKKVKFEFWMEVCVRIESYVGNSQQIMDILALSYEHLPPHLQRCFLYFGALPEDSDVLMFRLIWLWIAEGLVRPVEEKVVENVAEGYLMDLVDRNLIVVNKKNTRGTIKTCRMHDMLRQLCSRKVEERYLHHPITWYSRVASSSTSVISSNNRCFHSHGFHDISETMPCVPNIRAPFCYVEHEAGSKQIRTSYVYKFLKVLNLCSALLFIFPLEILRLFHLRFLELWILKLDTLPPKISNLWNLESLVITKEEGLGGITIPFSIWKMRKLRHLRISDELRFGKPPPYNMGYPNILNELQTLSALKLSHLHKHAEEVLTQTPNLKKLTFYRGPNKMGKFRFPNVSHLMHLESLKFSENSRQPTHTSIPGPHYFPHGLKKLILSGGHMDWKEISNLGKIQSLEVLKLRRNCFYGAEWRTDEGDFIRLKFLKLSWMDLEQWNTCDSHFPNLQHLVLERCKYLEEIPISLGAIPTLHVIEVHECSRSTLDSAKRIQQDQKDMGNDELQVIGNIVHNQSDECQVM